MLAIGSDLPVFWKSINIFYYIESSQIPYCRRPWTLATPVELQVRCQPFIPFPPEWASGTLTHSTKHSTGAASRRFSVRQWYHSGRAGSFMPKRGSPTFNIWVMSVSPSLSMRPSISVLMPSTPRSAAESSPPDWLWGSILTLCCGSSGSFFSAAGVGSDAEGGREPWPGTKQMFNIAKLRV